MKKINLYPVLLLLAPVFLGCNGATVGDAEKVAEPQTPVTIATVSTAPMEEYVELNATSGFLQKSYVKASSNGYIHLVDIQLGKLVNKGQHIFTLKTKESQSIGNSINALDSSYKFSGLINITASEDGYISELNHQVGDYVQEGEQLAVICNTNSFAFVMNLPYELRTYVLGKNNVELLLPDGKKLNGTVSTVLPVVDSVSQTQNVLIRVNEKNLPINLIAKVKVLKIAKNNTTSLPKSAILSDETQSNYWVMKVIDSTTAVKVPVSKGIETTDRIEIVSPKFSVSDEFLLTGNYGLPDTAKIKIIRRQGSQ